MFIGLQQEGRRFARSKYGINYAYLFPDQKVFFDKIPTIDLANFQTLSGASYPVKSAGTIYQLSNNLSKITGNHTLKFGFAYERTGQNDQDQANGNGVPGGSSNQNGRFVFTDNRPGSSSAGLAVANAALGLFATYAEFGQRAYTPYRANMLEWFAQDSWKVTPQLRMEFGMRYTYLTPYYFSLWGNIAVFDPGRYDPARAAVQDPRTGFVISGDRYNGVTIPGASWPEAAQGRVALAGDRSFDRLFNGGPNYWGRRQWANFQPRLGVAYAITSKNAIRAGFGRFLA